MRTKIFETLISEKEIPDQPFQVAFRMKRHIPIVHNGAVLAFVWTGAKLPDCTLHWVKPFTMSRRVSRISLLPAVSVYSPDASVR
ncbi:protein of unknown function (plasmid) [Cupriavidus taiwanensis]|uniref:Uncharacterized protein n=1 Tax=Cupriavidus taiwanensis TaxID=164546 RepID=A0A375ITK3_9BURK|nr:hypothetical protein CT19425_U580015 [Cupriavidus taiwanensis]SPK77518.1 protein of unknown function [Cupriavidus taiwanensis]